MRPSLIRLITWSFGLALFATSISNGADQERLARRPTRFALIFNMGYAGDKFPQNKENFAKLLLELKDAHFNVVLCKYTDWRERLCKEHDIAMMVDLLVPEHHVYKNPEGAKKLCESLRDSSTIYGYHIWSDNIGGTSEGRNRDIAAVHRWDPNHAVYVGSYNARGLGGLDGPDMIGYYDFHWKRGGLWRHLQRTADATKKTDSLFLKYTDGAPGRIGIGNYNRVLYTVSQSIAFGMKGYLFHYTGQEIDQNSWRWNTLGDDMAKVNSRVALLGPALMQLGNPSTVYSTAITKSAKDDAVERAVVPTELEAIPADIFFQVTSGEAVVGVFQDHQQRDAMVFANHNAYQPQAMRIQLKGMLKEIELLDWQTGDWTELKVTDGTIDFEIDPAACVLVRITR